MREKNQSGPRAKKKVADSVRWGNVFLQNRLVLAPMAGPGGHSFRCLCEHFGAAMTVTELCSARGILYDTNFVRNHRYLRIAGSKNKASIQLFGADPADMKKAVRRLLAHPEYGKTLVLDINMGCPVKKVVQTGAGSALMKTPDLAARIVEAASEAAFPYGKAVTVKFRSGWDKDHINAVSFGKKMEAAGAKALSLHARTREQMYGGRADWTIIGELAAQTSLPVAANGDIRTLEDCYTLLHTYGAELCMIGRGALGKPWIFKSILNEENNGSPLAPRPEERAKIILHHLNAVLETQGEEKGIREFRTSLVYYLKGMPKAAFYRNKAMKAENYEELKELIQEFTQGT